MCVIRFAGNFVSNFAPAMSDMGNIAQVGEILEINQEKYQNYNLISTRTFPLTDRTKK